MEPHGFLVAGPPLIVWKNSLFTGFLEVFNKLVKHVPEPAFYFQLLTFQNENCRWITNSENGKKDWLK